MSPYHVKNGVDMSDMDSSIMNALPNMMSLISKSIGGGYIPTITSGRDGVHMPDSLHYKGKALDIRTRDMSAINAQNVAQNLKDTLDKAGFDISLETDHIHIEYDPKPTDILPKAGAGFFLLVLIAVIYQYSKRKG